MASGLHSVKVWTTQISWHVWETLSHPLWRVPMSEGWERRREKFGPELEMSTILHLVCPSRLLSALIERQQWDHLPLGFW